MNISKKWSYINRNEYNGYDDYFLTTLNIENQVEVRSTDRNIVKVMILLYLQNFLIYTSHRMSINYFLPKRKLTITSVTSFIEIQSEFLFYWTQQRAGEQHDICKPYETF